MSDGMRKPLVRFLDALEAIGAEHDEVYDTAVREAMGAVLEQRLITRSRRGDLSEDFGMFSPEGNRLVRDAVAGYLAEAGPVADAESRRGGPSRVGLGRRSCLAQRNARRRVSRLGRHLTLAVRGHSWKS